MPRRDISSYPGNRSPSAPPMSPRPLDFNPPIEDVYEQEERDAELARRLQAEEEAAVAGLQHNHNTPFPRSEHNIPQSTFTTPPATTSTADNNINNTRTRIPIVPVHATDSNNYTRTEIPTVPVHATVVPVPIPADTIIDSPFVMTSLEADEEFARRTQQELRDEALAMELQRKEQEARNHRHHHNHRTVVPVEEYHGQQGMNPNRGRRSRCTNRRIFSAGIMAIIVGIAAICIVFFGSSIWQRLGGNVDDLPPFFQDQWDDTNSGSTGEFSAWKNEGKGLELEIRNSLSSDWDPFFVKAVNDWNEAPALSLSTEIIDIDPDCKSVQGVMKVCNDYYGKTGWTGLNEVYFNRSFIAASVAKMNESYLNGKNDAEKQYVMCHEIGHGFGLPHRDENANNPDLGSCLDYTYRYQNNMNPDAVVDFDNLFNLYGSTENDNTGRKRNLRMDKNAIQREQNGENIEQTSFPTITNSRANYKEGRLLHQSKHYEMYENDLGDGNRVVTTVLLHQEENLG